MVINTSSGKFKTKRDYTLKSSRHLIQNPTPLLVLDRTTEVSGRLNYFISQIKVNQKDEKSESINEVPRGTQERDPRGLSLSPECEVTDISSTPTSLFPFRTVRTPKPTSSISKLNSLDFPSDFHRSPLYSSSSLPLPLQNLLPLNSKGFSGYSKGQQESF